MQNQKNKLGIDALWKKYQHTLELLADALERLETKPKEIEIPVTEFVEVPKIVEVEVVKELTLEQKDAYEKQIIELKKQIQVLQAQKPNIDYWGRPKTSIKTLDDRTYEQQLEQRYERLVQEIKAGTLDINALDRAEAEIVKQLLNE
tara:strand:- start:352 stop:792 length:441 start_codon:yes stop_codon:yes gene_type:complete